MSIAATLSKHVVAITLLVVLAAAAIHALAMPRGLVSSDEGIRLAQVQGLAASSLTDGSLYEHGTRYTPDHSNDLFTNMAGYAEVDPATHRAYGTYPLLYPALAVPLYVLGGPFAVSALSFLGLALTLVAIARLARHCQLGEPLVAAVVALSGLMSSLLFYSALVFEHTLASAALITALLLVVRDPPRRSRFAVAGALYGLATCFRTELYAFAPAMALVLAWAVGIHPRSWRAWLTFGGAAVAVLAADVIAHRLATPFWHPTLHMSQAAAPSTLPVRFTQLVPGSLFVPGRIMVEVTVMAAVVAWWIASSRRGPDQLLTRLITVVVTLGWAALAVKAIVSVDGVHVRELSGVFTATPLVALASVRAEGRADGRAAARSPIAVLTFAAALFVAILTLLPKRASGGGLEFGARYLTPIVPLLFIAALDHARRHRIHAACAAVMVGLGAWGTLVNLGAERSHRGMGANVVAAMDDTRAEAMITQVWWVALLAIPAQDRAALYVSQAPTTIYDRLYDGGVRRVVSVRGPPPASAGHIRLRELGPSRVVDPRVSSTLWELFDPDAR